MRFLTLLFLSLTTSLTPITALPLDDTSLVARDASPATRPRPNHCPNFANLNLNAQREDKAAALFSYGKCNWKQVLICASLVVGCPVACASVISAAINPLSIAECVACVGLTSGNCAFCWGQITEQRKEFCGKVPQFPPAMCLMPLCEAPKVRGPVLLPKITS